LRVALAVFWLNLLLLGLTLWASWRYATAHGLLREDVSYEVQRAIEFRIIVAQALYAAGFALCVFSTLWSIAAIVLVQLVFAIGPTIRWLRRQGPLGRGDPRDRFDVAS